MTNCCSNWTCPKLYLSHFSYCGAVASFPGTKRLNDFGYWGGPLDGLYTRPSSALFVDSFSAASSAADGNRQLAALSASTRTSLRQATRTGRTRLGREIAQINRAFTQRIFVYTGGAFTVEREGDD